MPQGKTRTPRDRREVTGNVGHDNQITVDWPRSIGFFGALGVAAALELVPMSVAIFVAAVPFLNDGRPRRKHTAQIHQSPRRRRRQARRGDSEGTVRWAARSRRKTGSGSRRGRRQ
jgi:hypothetical protein